jgi:WD40 repeat protein
MMGTLLAGVAALEGSPLWLVVAEDRAQVWMGATPGTATIPGRFPKRLVGQFVVRPPGPGAEGAAARSLFPFVCYLPDPAQERRLHFYDSMYQYKPTRKEATVLEYDTGERHERDEPARGLEEAFNADLLAQAFKWNRSRMAVIEGRVANFGEILETHANVVGRQFAVDRVRAFVRDNDRGLLVIEGEPGKGKTALVAHLVEEVFGHVSPRPAHFFYRRTAGITDPEVCVRSLYHSLLETHGITEAEEARRQTTPAQVYNKLLALLGKEIGPRLSPSRPQLIFIDALDEADGDAFRRIPEHLPPGVYVVVSTRPVPQRATLARRAHLHWFDLDHPDLLQENLRDGAEYVRRELLHVDVPDGTADEVARVGGGNFLVLKLLCQHVRARLRPEEVKPFLRRLATGSRQDQLGFIYEEFWQRLTAGRSREDVQILCDVAGTLVTAHAPLTREVICDVVGLRAAGWDFALRRLAEYLTAVEDAEDGVPETFYRVYHESFADFLAAKTATDRAMLFGRLADYCRGWEALADGYGRTYALRFGPTHLIEVGAWDELTRLLTDLTFVTEKCAAGFTGDLAADYELALRHLPGAAGPAASAGPPPVTAGADAAELLAQLRTLPRGQRHPPPQKPRFQAGEIIASEHFGADDRAVAATVEMRRAQRQRRTRPGVNTAADSPARVRAFANFVGRCGHLLAEAPADTVVIAHNFARGGPVVEAAEELARGLNRPWVARVVRPLPPPERPLCLRSLAGHTAQVLRVALSGDGRMAVSASDDGTLRVWDVASGSCRQVLGDRPGGYTAVALTPDGRLALSAGKDRCLAAWDPLTGVRTQTLPGHAGAVTGVGVTADGRLAVSSSEDQTLRVWDLAAGSCVRAISPQVGRLLDVAVTPDGRLALTAGKKHGARVLDVATGECLRALAGVGQQVSCLALGEDGRLAATGSHDGSVRLWAVGSGVCLRSLEGHTKRVSSVALSRCGQVAVSAADDGTVRVWSVASGECLRLFQANGSRALGVALGGDCQLVVTAEKDHVLGVWAVATGAPEARFAGHRVSVRALALSAAGRTLVSASGDRTLVVWDPTTGRPFQRLVGHARGVDAVCVSPDGRTVVSGSEDQTVRIWDAFPGRCVRTLEGHTGFVHAVAFLSGGRDILSCGGDATAFVWDALTGAVLSRRPLTGGRVTAVAAHGPDGIVTAAHADHVIRTWDVHTGECRRTFSGHADVPLGLAVTPDGRTLVSAGADGTVRLWDLASAECLGVLRGHADAVLGVALCRDGQTVVSAGKDRTVRVWDVRTLACLAVYRYGSPVTAVAPLGSAGRFACGLWNGEVHFLELRPGAEIAVAGGTAGDEDGGQRKSIGTGRQTPK